MSGPLNRNTKRPHSDVSKKRRRVPPCMKIEWSDGVLRFQGQENGPTPEQRRPDNPAGYMVEVPRGSKKEIMWLQKLGAGLVEHFQKDLKETIRQPIYLHELPYGYRLFQTLGKGNNRSDMYLYGHPMGPRKRYRSPKEFEKHAIWLASDLTRNPANCTCDKCKGDGHREPPELPQIQQQKQQPQQQQQQKTATEVQISTTISKPPQVQPIAAAYQAVPPQPLAVVTPKPPSMETALLASKTHSERDNDLTPVGLNIYRLGEQVWFQTGVHWALGVVSGIPTLSQGNDSYNLIPLMSPLMCEKAAPMTGLQPEQLRPWVAWTTPPVTSPALAREDIDYERLPWQEESINPTMEVDASIIKSRDVEASWTLIDRLTPQGYYAGIYHGAEKFWVGDAVRVKVGAHPNVTTGQEIFIVSSIRDLKPDTPRGVRVKEMGVLLTGDLYRMASSKQRVPAPQVMPTTVLKDLMSRSLRTAPTNPETPFWTYVPLAQGIEIKLEDVKGRWYPSEALFIIIHGAEALNVPGGVDQKLWDDTGSKMNEMGTSGQALRLGRRRYNERHHAFAHAIKSTVTFDSSSTQPQAQMGHPGGVRSDAPPSQAPIPQGGSGGHVGGGSGGGSDGGEVVDLTGDDPMGFLEDDDFMRKMGEDAASFLADDQDGFYPAL
ncbi:hypothetical protein EX30DRAFT_337898 [Ascodesmis nigricans]|uniref:Cryptic loci regulator 2 N-terminal domain-containing protein n=1 Tax=Ascodesmis nigricans TaxID=341454 RepID=A0A4S2N8A1_9PEZI|nr:hypothetical protein EX30DRAFT_337898 [Ascodesmis nigricans]